MGRWECRGWRGTAMVWWHRLATARAARYVPFLPSRPGSVRPLPFQAVRRQVGEKAKEEPKEGSIIIRQ